MRRMAIAWDGRSERGYCLQGPGELSAMVLPKNSLSSMTFDETNHPFQNHRPADLSKDKKRRIRIHRTVQTIGLGLLREQSEENVQT